MRSNDRLAPFKDPLLVDLGTHRWLSMHVRKHTRTGLHGSCNNLRRPPSSSLVCLTSSHLLAHMDPLVFRFLLPESFGYLAAMMITRESSTC